MHFLGSKLSGTYACLVLFNCINYNFTCGNVCMYCILSLFTGR